MKKLILVMIVFLFVSCKKDERKFPDFLIGTWPEVRYNYGVANYKCDVKFSKLADDQLKMEILNDDFAGDKYILNVDGDGETLHAYSQSFDNDGNVTVSGSGYAKGGGFTLAISRTKANVTIIITYLE
jgi:hypothetical protein